MDSDDIDVLINSVMDFLAVRCVFRLDINSDMGRLNINSDMGC